MTLGIKDHFDCIHDLKKVIFTKNESTYYQVNEADRKLF